MEQQERQFIEQIGMFLESTGMPRMAGRLLGFLLICTPPEQSSAQLAAALSASKGSISTNTRLLLASGLIEKVAVVGERSSWFRVRPRAWEQIMEKKLSGLSVFRGLIEQGIAMLEADDERRARLEETHEFYVFLEKEFPLIISRWRAQKENS